jgi:hypothetical protein
MASVFITSRHDCSNSSFPLLDHQLKSLTHEMLGGVWMEFFITVLIMFGLIAKIKMK